MVPFSAVVLPFTGIWTSSGTTWPHPRFLGDSELTPVAQSAPAIGLATRPVVVALVGHDTCDAGCGAYCVGFAARNLNAYEVAVPITYGPTKGPPPGAPAGSTE